MNHPKECFAKKLWETLAIPYIGSDTFALGAGLRPSPSITATLSINGCSNSGWRVTSYSSRYRLRFSGSSHWRRIASGSSSWSFSGRLRRGVPRATPDGRTREREGFVTTVDAEFGVCVGVLICTGEFDEWAWNSVATSSNLHLHTWDKVFRLVNVRSMNAYVKGLVTRNSVNQASFTYQYALHVLDIPHWEYP